MHFGRDAKKYTDPEKWRLHILWNVLEIRG